jgi:TolB protein
VGDELFVLTGSSPKRIAAPRASAPVWSADGSTLAFLRRPADGEGSTLWTTSMPDGEPTRVRGLPGPLLEAAWAPAGDVLAVLVQDPAEAGSTLWLVSVDGAPERFVSPEGGVTSFAWRPDAKALAYAATTSRPGAAPSDTLYVRTIDGGAETSEFTAEGDGIMLAGWWPDGRGLLFWRDPQHSTSMAADGLPLFSLRLGTGAPASLETTLTYEEWISWAPYGRRFVTVAGGGRFSWHDKSLAVCDVVAGRCTALPSAPGTVSLDPAWSPTGEAIAFVGAADVGERGADPSRTWLETRKMWLVAPDGSSPHEVSGSSGAFGPQWDRRGRTALLVAGGRLELRDAGDGSARTIVDPFPAPSGDFYDPAAGSYYGFGFLSRRAHIAWWKG